MSAHFDVPNMTSTGSGPARMGLLMRAMEDAMGPRRNSPYQQHIDDGKAMRPKNMIAEVVAAAPKVIAKAVEAPKHIMPPAATMPKLPEAPLFRTRRAA